MSEKIQELENKLANAANQEEKVNLLIELTAALAGTDIKKAMTRCAEAIECARAIPYPTGLARSLIRHSQFNSQLGNYHAALEQVIEAQAIYENLEDNKGIFETLVTLSNIYQVLGNYADSLECALQARRLAQTLGDEHRETKAIFYMGLAVGQADEHEKALAYYQEALDMYESGSFEDEYGRSLTLNNMAMALYRMGAYEDALSYGLKSLKLTQQLGGKHFEPVVLDTVSLIYVKLGDLNSGLEYALECLHSSQQLSLVQQQVWALHAIGRIYQQQQDTQALDYFHQAQELAQQINAKRELYESHELLAEAYESQGDYEKAFIHYKQFHKLNKEAFNDESNARLQTLNVQHQTEIAQREAKIFEQKNIELEKEIKERKEAEALLAKRASELEMVSRVSTSTTSIRETDKLLQEVVDLTKSHFGLYHVHIYLLDANGQTLILVAGAGDVGRQMVSEGHDIPLHRKQSLVAQAARSKQGVTVNDVRENPAFLPHPLLPNTRAEMTVPMIVSDQVIGVLDVQSDEVGRFTEQDIMIATTLAAQIGVALENARSFEKAQEAVANLNELTRGLTREGWQDFLVNRVVEDMGFVYDASQLTSLQPLAEVENVWLSGENESGLTVDDSSITYPITVHDVPIGQLAIVPDEVSEDVGLDIAEIISAVTEHLGVRIENIRLFEQTQAALEESEALYVGSERIVVSNTEKGVLRGLIESTILKNMDGANIFMFDEPVEDGMARDVTAVAVWENEGVPRTVQVGTRFTVEQVPLMKMITPERSIVVTNIYEDPRIDDATRQILENYGMISFVLFPMVVGSQWLGMVSGQSISPVVINDAQQRQASSLVSQASVVLQTIVLFRQEQARARREQLLREIATKMRSSTDVDTIMRTAVTEIGKTLGRRSFIELGNSHANGDRNDNGATS
ncbi:tetratricopeptide repeat protein [Candidatus Leptofilum sp.]|uniref:tetratricopeptide repeat protein n=1 Tax=Candidatus Leptofilum sp. TaxID=3241576 RepID=UPI003B593465